MERFTKVAVTLWACAAVALQVWLLRSWANLASITLIAAIVSMILVRIDRRLIAGVLVVAYVSPSIVQILHGTQYSLFGVIWLGAVLGAVLPDALLTPWHIPIRWRGALVFAALAVAVGTMVTVWREVDGNLPALISQGSVFWVGSPPPRFTLTWTLNVALVLMVGLLWFDWLLGANDVDFERVIVPPLIISACAMALVAIYQRFVDMTFLNSTVFAANDRATGTMYDANVTGILAALWLGGVFLWSQRLKGWRRYVAPVAMIVFAGGVWSSGSRTAITAATIITLTIMFSLALSGPRIDVRRAVIALGGALLVVGALAAIGASSTSRSQNPMSRIFYTLATFRTPQALAREMWNRNGYGAVAVNLISRFPVSGVGVGGFHTLARSTGRMIGVRTPPDNAQNWVRHEVAEFGLVGGLGWMIWYVSFAAFVLIPRRNQPPTTWLARGILVAFGFISWFGMPGQDAMVAITFWTIAFWYVSLVGRPPAGERLGRWTWLGMAVALAVFAVASVSAANGDLRLDQHAIQRESPFSYGFEPLQPEGPTVGYHRTQARAAMLVDSEPGWMAITVRLEDGAAGSRPLDVRVRWEGNVVLKARLTDGTPITGYVPVDPALPRQLLEATARYDGLAGWWPLTRDVGLLLKWEHVDQPPPKMLRYDSRPTGTK